MQKQRYLGLTPAQLNGVFIVGLAVVLSACCAWLFALGGQDKVRGPVDETVDEVRSLSGALGVDRLSPQSDLPPIDTARPISDEELGRMEPGLTDFGPEFAGFTPDQENGLRNIETTAEDDFDVAGERADLARFGFAAGFEAHYYGSAATVVGTTALNGQVMLFQTSEGAAAYMDDSEAELLEYSGQTFGNVSFLDAGTFDIDVDADQAMGSQGTARIAHEDGSYTDVWIAAADYRLGRLIASVGIAAMGPGEIEKERLREKVETLAQTMSERIAAVLAAGGATAATAAAGQ